MPIAVRIIKVQERSALILMEDRLVTLHVDHAPADFHAELLDLDALSDALRYTLRKHSEIRVNWTTLCHFLVAEGINVRPTLASSNDR